MNKKNILTAAVSLSLVACLSIGATLAYFTDTTETKQNTFTTGNVKINLIDELPENFNPADHTWTADDSSDAGISYGNVMPGDTLDKIVGVQTDFNSSDAYLAMRLTISGPSDDVAGVGKWYDLAEQIAMDIQSSGKWRATISNNADGAYVDCYYLEAVSGGAYVNLIEEVQIPAVWGNEITNGTFTISAEAAAIQAANLDAPNTVPGFNDTALELKALLNEG